MHLHWLHAASVSNSFLCVCVCLEQSSEGPPPPLSLAPEAKEPTLDNPSATDELDTPTSIASVVTSTNESSLETDTPHQTDTEVFDSMFTSESNYNIIRKIH